MISLTAGVGNWSRRARVCLYSCVLQKAVRSACGANATVALPFGLNRALLSSIQSVAVAARCSANSSTCRARATILLLTWDIFFAGMVSPCIAGPPHGISQRAGSALRHNRPPRNTSLVDPACDQPALLLE